MTKQQEHKRHYRSGKARLINKGHRKHIKKSYGMGVHSEKIKKLVSDAKFELNPYAQSYYGALDESEDMGGEKGVKTQALYLHGNLRAKTPEQKLAKQQLLDYGYGKPIREELEVEPKDTLSEIELGNISDDFEDWSMEKRRGDEDKKVDLDMFKDFAQKRGYDVDKVLFSNPWVDDVLTEDAKEAVGKAKKKIKVPEWE